MRNRKKRESNDLFTFLAGLAMLVAGLYWFTTIVSVSSSFFGGRMSLGGFSFNSGLVVVPFIVCIIWLFVKPESFMAKVCVGLSVLMIITSVIMTTRLHMRTLALYEYLLMLIFIFGGGALVLKVLCNPKYKEAEEDPLDFYNNATEYADELEKLKKKNKR